MRIALVGWGIETKSAYQFMGPEHEYLIVSEEPRGDFPQSDNVKIKTLSTARKPGLSGNSTDLSYLNGLEEYDLVVYSPSARKNMEKVYLDDSTIWKRAKSTMHLFFETCPTKNIIGITGTKGKGTTTTLIEMLLKSNGLRTHIGGNIGIPVLDLLKEIEEDDWVVLELSSFQLYKFPYSPHIGVHLMMIPEHLDEWHITMEDYVASKRNIFANQSEDDIAVYHAYNEFSIAIVDASPGKHIPFMSAPGAYVDDDNIVIDNQIIIATKDVALHGKHNLENVCAAITAVWQVHQNTEMYNYVISTFAGLEHRLQLIREINGISYYDDSFGTTPDTSIVAMDAIPGQKVMIVGGHDKGNDFTGMINRLKGDDIRAIICLGITGKYIADKLIEYDINKLKIVQKEQINDWTMHEIINAVNNHAKAGDSVLLSTGSASFGIFEDYKDRGNQFINEVNSL